MALRQLSDPPKTEDFTPLREHQEQTPSTFFGAKPVLYAHQSDLTLSAQVTRLQENPFFAGFKAEPQGDSEDALIPNVEAWVSSDDLILFQATPSPTGVAVAYPSIALHATMKYKSSVEALLLNLSLNDAETVNNDEDINVMELVILPPGHAGSSPQTACIQEIFGAMNTCADLHPDPDDDEEEGDVLDETAPGATGWITADNMDEFVDEEGNFRGREIGAENEELGPGAGYVRLRDETDGDADVNGDGHEGKYQRTE